MSAMIKTSLREIKSSFGRFLAIFAIIALGVGFFSGLKISKSAMIKTGDEYMSEHGMFDYRVISTLGYSEDDVLSLSSLSFIKDAEGAMYSDFIAQCEGSDLGVMRAHSLTEKINTLSVISGRLPSSSGECVVDSRYYGEDMIGKELSVSEATNDGFVKDTFTVVGLVDSTYYLNYERGSTSLGNGSLSAFMYVLPEDFASDVFHEVFLTLKVGGTIYSEEYENNVESGRSETEELAQKLADDRYDEIISEALEKIESAEKEYSDGIDALESARTELDERKEQLEAAMDFLPEQTIEEALAEIAKAENEIAENENKLARAKEEIDSARSELSELKAPVTYVFTRNENTGYVCFDNDSSIVDGVANVFPVFFFLIAALVCTTTMTRMVSDQRTLIGVFKSIGYGNSSIVMKYIAYAGTAAVTGCISGYLIGIFFIPRFIWEAYAILYGFAPISFVFSLPLAIISLSVSLLCSVGAVYLSCRRELMRTPAQLLRPKSPKSGKRVLPERIGFLWKRLSFLAKITARNLFRYKKRVFMMILGIGGCTALLLAGFGIRDSISLLIDDQYERITTYDYNIVFSDGLDEDDMQTFSEAYREYLDDPVFLHESIQNASANGQTKSVYLVTADEGIEKHISLVDKKTKEPLDPPGENEAIIAYGLAERLSLSVGDEITVLYDDRSEVTLTVSGICDNYIYYYVYVDRSSFESALGEELSTKTVIADRNPDASLELSEISALISEYDNVASVTETETMVNRVENMLTSLNKIVLLVLVSAGALAFIVLYNLTSINITEREREIATVKVLGFYPNETAGYVFRENYILTAIGALAGLIGGRFLLGFIMDQIKVDIMIFDVSIKWQSVLLSLALTFVFAIAVNFAMRFRLRSIDMTSSLKSVD